MIRSLVRWLARAAGRPLAVPSRGPTAEDNLGAGI
jgi:hypothetical protein